MPVAQTTGRHLKTKAEGVTKSVSPRTGRVTWEARYTNSDGERVYEKCASFEAAKARRAEATHRVGRGEVVTSTSVTFADVLVGWREWRKVKERSAVNYDAHVRVHLLPRFGQMKVKDISRATLKSWLNSLTREDMHGGEMGDGTKRILLSTLSNILDYAVDSNLLSVNPARALGRAKPRQTAMDPRILGEGELDRLLAAAASWLRPIILCTLYGALRLGEVVGLTWADVDFDAGTINVHQQIDPNGKRQDSTKGAAATIPLSPQARKLLATLKLAAQDSSPGAPVFVNGLGTHRHPRDVQRAFTKARAKLSVEPRAFRFHDLRHTAVSMLANMPGADMVQVQAYARHAAMTTTLGYVHKIEKPEWADTLGEAFAVFGS
jgi:integrase